MKFKFLFIAFLLPLFAIAQNTEGEIVFTEKIELHIELPEDMAKEMKDQIPTSQSFTKSLLFTEKEALYKDWEANENEDLEVEHESDGMQFKMVMKVPENIFYTDIENNSSVNSREFFGRMFLIDGDAEKFQWKLTGEQKKIQDFICQKATCQVDEENITAWFSPQIPVSTGPAGYGGLPGMILEVDINEGRQVISASKIEMKKLEKNAIAQPTKGKKVSKEEFKKIEDEKMKELEEEMGGSGGGVKMIIRQ